MIEMGHNRAESSLMLAVLFGFAALVTGIGAFGCRPSSDALDPQTLPENVRSDYQVFARRCSKCHSLARPLTAGITDQGQWENYVRRMRMQPASGITAEDQVLILRFLKYYSDEERKKKAEKNGESTQVPATPFPTSAPSTGKDHVPPAPALPSTPASTSASSPSTAPSGT